MLIGAVLQKIAVVHLCTPETGKAGNTGKHLTGLLHSGKAKKKLLRKYNFFIPFLKSLIPKHLWGKK